MSLEQPPQRKPVVDAVLLVRSLLGAGGPVSAEAMTAIERCRTPRNVLRLRNAVDRARILANGELKLLVADLEPAHSAEILRQLNENQCHAVRCFVHSSQQIARVAKTTWPAGRRLDDQLKPAAEP